MEEEDDEQLKLMSMKDLSVCPSFSSYSADRYADIAAKVGEQLRAEAEAEAGSGEEIDTTNVCPDEEDDDFEFSFVRCEDHDLRDDEFREVFPIFNRDLLIEVNQVSSDESTLKISLKKLFLEDREGDHPLCSSSSSSEVDELEAIPSETYCVWKPKAVEESPNTCKKSRSTGSGSKRWKIRDLLGRSNSDGKNAFVFLTPKRDQKQKSEKTEILEEGRMSEEEKKKKAKEKRVLSSSSPAPEMQQQPVYLRKRGMKEGEKRKSYLPYRKDLVGFFTSVNGIGRSFPPF